MFRFTMINHLCNDLPTLIDATRPTDQWIGWSSCLPASGNGARSLGQEIESSTRFLSIDQLGTHMGSYTDSVPSAAVPIPAASVQPDVGVKTYAQLNCAMSTVTGVPMADQLVETLYNAQQESMPSSGNIGAFHHGTGLARCAAEARARERGAGGRTAKWPARLPPRSPSSASTWLAGPIWWVPRPKWMPRTPPTQEPSITGAGWPIFTAADCNDPDVAATATIMKRVINGFAAAGTITLARYDYHDGTRATGETLSYHAGQMIGAVLEHAKRVGKPVMIYGGSCAGRATTRQPRPSSSSATPRADRSRSTVRHRSRWATLTRSGTS